jgi:hypothetical protein
MIQNYYILRNMFLVHQILLNIQYIYIKIILQIIKNIYNL